MISLDMHSPKIFVKTICSNISTNCTDIKTKRKKTPIRCFLVSCLEKEFLGSISLYI